MKLLPLIPRLLATGLLSLGLTGCFGVTRTRLAGATTAPGGSQGSLADGGNGDIILGDPTDGGNTTSYIERDVDYRCTPATGPAVASYLKRYVVVSSTESLGLYGNRCSPATPVSNSEPFVSSPAFSALGHLGENIFQRVSGPNYAVDPIVVVMCRSYDVTPGAHVAVERLANGTFRASLTWQNAQTFTPAAQRAVTLARANGEVQITGSGLTLDVSISDRDPQRPEERVGELAATYEGTGRVIALGCRIAPSLR